MAEDLITHEKYATVDSTVLAAAQEAVKAAYAGAPTALQLSEQNPGVTADGVMSQVVGSEGSVDNQVAGGGLPTPGFDQIRREYTDQAPAAPDQHPGVIPPQPH